MTLARRLTPDQLDAVRAVARYVLDRASQYDESSGIYDALCTLGASILAGEAEAAWFVGELDDPALLEWQKRILRGLPLDPDALSSLSRGKEGGQ